MHSSSTDTVHSNSTNKVNNIKEKKVINPKYLPLLIKIFLSLAKADGKISNKEVASIVRYFLSKYSDKYADKINKQILKYGTDPGDILETARKLKDLLDMSDKFELILDLMALVYIDDASEEEFYAINEIGKIFEISEEKIKTLHKIFISNFFSYTDDIDVLSIASHHLKSDIPIPHFEGRIIIFRYHKDLFLLSLKRGNALFNKETFRSFFVINFNQNDKLSIYNYEFSYQDIHDLMNNKASLDEKKYFIIKDMNSIYLLNEDPGDSLVELVHKKNKVIFHNLSEDIKILTEENLVSKSEASLMVLYDKISFSIEGLNGNILLGKSALDFDDFNLMEIADLEMSDSQIDLNQYDDNLPENCIFSFEKDLEEFTGRVSEYYGEIRVNGKVVESPFLFKESDSIRIGNLSFEFDIFENKLKVHKVSISKIKANRMYAKFKKANSYAIQDITFEVKTGEMTAILGPAGAGKSTLLNALLGDMKLERGSILVNGIKLKKGLLQIRDSIGFVPQDDLLLQELTVLENIYYKYKLKFPERRDSKKRIEKKIISVLEKVGLQEKIHSMVGSPEDRKLSGGERKRLNIALDLITDPDVLILDEPTSGLSSQDASEIIKMLRKIANSGKIVILVIHQPSSVIYKKFDKVLILNKGGSLAFFGDRLEALSLFKDMIGDEDETQEIECSKCKTVNPDLLMKSLKNESGGFWHAVSYLNKVRQEEDKEENENKLPVPPNLKYNLYQRLRQNFNQFKRLFLCKFRDKMNLSVTLVVSPVLSILSAFLLRYNPDKNLDYEFAKNPQYIIFLFLIVLVAIFFGLTNSTPEIIKDRLTLKREKLINTSTIGYLSSKFFVLMIFAIIQDFLFILPAHIILEEYNMIFYNWMFMIVLSAAGVTMGLMVSTFLKSTTAAYNLVPLILVPQIILGGAMVEYKKMNEALFLNKRSPIPAAAQVMVSRWGYEMLFTANYDLHPYYRSIQKEREEKKELNQLLMNNKITVEERDKRRDMITKKYSLLLAELKPQVNHLIKETQIGLSKDEYLYKKNSWFGGRFRTWLRDLLVLIFMSNLFLFVSYVNLARQKRNF